MAQSGMDSEVIEIPDVDSDNFPDSGPQNLVKGTDIL